MIVDLLVIAFLGVLNAVLSLIPDFEAWDPATRDPTGGLTNMAWTGAVGSLLALWDLFFPIGALFASVLAIFAARVFVVVVTFLRWIWEVLPFKSS